ncbi:hypothetical protein P3T40_008240 [Paraburkholderia sp. EB58]|jgi:hypothetical protein|uniref:GtrA family protein n=1 Tax=Paraburkholderia sp. EB58 TaxID=3035125 RepID=UPI003D1BB740
MKLGFLYAFFACISAAANFGAQAIAVRIFSGHYAIFIALVVGTLTGLVVKYLLDKQWIFRWQSAEAMHNARTFVLYALTGVATTLIFWGIESIFQWRFDSEPMRYLGGSVGLAIGYVTKFRLDRMFVFVGRPVRGAT